MSVGIDRSIFPFCLCLCYFHFRRDLPVFPCPHLVEAQEMPPARPATRVRSNEASRPRSKVARDAIQKRNAASKVSMIRRAALESGPTPLQNLKDDRENTVPRQDGESFIRDKRRIEVTPHTSLLRVGPRRILAAEDDNLIIRVENLNSTPAISRKLSVPVHCTMAQLCWALQISLGLALAVAPHSFEGHWLEFHTWEFWFTKGRRSGDPRRIVRQPTTFDLSDFDDGDVSERLDASTVKLSDLLIEAEWLGPWRYGRCVWKYDLSQDWTYKMEFLGRAPRTDQISCLEGSGHPPAEDAGPELWYSLSRAYKKSEVEWDDNDRDNVKWYEEVCMNGDSEGLRGDRVTQFVKPNKDEVNELLKRILESQPASP